MEITAETVAEEHERLRADETIPELINETRDRLGPLFGVEVEHVPVEAYRREVDAVFAEGDLAVNVAALCALLRDLDCAGDYPGFVVDEFLGRKLAATIAGGEPFALLAEATFHFADMHTHDSPDDTAGADDLDAALAAGFQTRLPGWDWTDGASPFDSIR
ncbi:MAG: hypothetical protein RI560_03795 [Natronomonas sp.]|jgi:hypothetical protein|uniref:DUF7984 domain-containing protein n=1 Tax=Natronomonas salsuginis TaxID=2217661 RepID=A0A4V5ZNN4_9EURY|nr:MULTISPECIES: hypothetical protein [Natronomonas]MDR9380782.1 hypothetical protein [Natronomonas sp.]MDR9429438.1 hypothetical protein [Natronomonas sp.]TKR25573.1 hypothetical protein DM868_09135 [Natronomonas salsuginis]